MEMRPIRIFAMGVLGLAIALLFQSVAPYVLYGIAIAPLALLSIGQFYLPRSKRSIQVWFNPIVLELNGELVPLEHGFPLGRLSGKELTYGAFKQWHEFDIVPHRFWLLAVIGFLSLGAFGLLWIAHEQLLEGLSFLYLAGSIWVTIVLLAWRWVQERRSLRYEGLSIGAFSVKTNHRPPYFQIRYHFVDPEGEYRGDIFDSMYCDRKDDMTVIFYDKDNADRSIPASALVFHRLVWKSGLSR